MSTWDDAVRNVENLTTVVKGQDAKYYDVYFDPTPKDVEIPKLNEDDTIGTVTIPNVAKLNQIFETWKESVKPALGYIPELGSKVNTGVNNVAIGSMFEYENSVVWIHPAGYAIDKPFIAVGNGSTVWVEIAIYTSLGAIKGALSLTRDAGGYLGPVSFYNDTNAYSGGVGGYLGPVSFYNDTNTYSGGVGIVPRKIRMSLGVIDGFGDDGKQVKLVLIVAGDDSADVSLDDIPAISVFTGLIRVINSDNFEAAPAVI